MPILAIFAAVIFCLSLATPAQAYDKSTTYNTKNAPAGQQRDAGNSSNTDEAEDKAAATSEKSNVDLSPPEQELSTPQKEEQERHRVTGEGSDVFHGDENQWPHSGRMH